VQQPLQSIHTVALVCCWSCCSLPGPRCLCCCRCCCLHTAHQHCTADE
jgi:hypothetical protein